MLFNAVFVAAVAASVSAHGFIQKCQLGGKTYTSSFPFDSKTIASPIRKISTTSPIKNANDATMNCGIGSQKASLVASVNPGDKVSTWWNSKQSQPWAHTMGPIMTYIAQVPAGQTADKYDTKAANWIKIAQAGQKGGAGTTWVMSDLTKGQSYSFNLPKNLPAGDYILRQETIALHFAWKQKNGAQFYSQCIQIRVGGGAKSPQPIAAKTVKFPGAYTNNDVSLYVPNIFKKGFKYTFPGGALYTGGSSKRDVPVSNATEPVELEGPAPVVSVPQVEPVALDGPAPVVSLPELDDEDDEAEEKQVLAEIEAAQNEQTKRAVVPAMDAHRKMLKIRKL